MIKLRSHPRLVTIVLYIRYIPRGIDNTYGARRRGRRRVHAEGLLTVKRSQLDHNRPDTHRFI